MLKFKDFFTTLLEGGHAIKGAVRADKEKIEQALKAVSRALRLPLNTVRERALGSVDLVLSGHKQDAGDIDIVAPEKEMARFDRLMRAKFAGTLNKNLKVGSYAVPVDGGKVQVDLIFSPNIEWAKFIYSSEHGRKSKYPGAVRNILMITAVTHTHKPGEDAIKKDDGQVIARASRALKMQTGLERLFKAARVKRDGTYAKDLVKVEPRELEAYLDKDTFKADADIINDPKGVVEWLFGKGVGPKDVETAEQVIELIKKLPNAAEIVADAKERLARAKLPIPEEL